MATSNYLISPPTLQQQAYINYMQQIYAQRPLMTFANNVAALGTPSGDTTSLLLLVEEDV